MGKKADSVKKDIVKEKYSYPELQNSIGNK